MRLAGGFFGSGSGNRSGPQTYFRKCGFIALIEMEYLDQPRDFECPPYKWGGRDEADPSLVLADSAYGIHHHAERGTVQIGNLRQVDDDLMVAFFNEVAKSVTHFRAGMQVDFAFERDNWYLVFRHLCVDFEIQSFTLPPASVSPPWAQTLVM